MTERHSLFARKLRQYRAGQGAEDVALGRVQGQQARGQAPGQAPGHSQGRMTQEQLAERLGLSAEAIGKYERSRSYIRGDYEARLIERLGWTSAEVAACRLDWETHHLRPRQGGYRVVDGAEYGRGSGRSVTDLARAITQLVVAELPEISDEFGADDDLWIPIIERFPSHGVVVLAGDTLVAHWGVQFLDTEDRARFRDRAFVEADLSADKLIRPVLPGAYYAYCPVVVIARGHEAAAPLLLTSVQKFLEGLAARGVVLEALGAAGVTAEGRQLCRQLGFERLGPHRVVPDCDVWEWPGAAIAGSLLGRRSPVLRAAYTDAFRVSA